MSLPEFVLMKSVNGDIRVPTVGFGTYASGDNSWCYDATLHALKTGYRHIDCAWHYGVLPHPNPWLRTSYVRLTRT